MRPSQLHLVILLVTCSLLAPPSALRGQDVIAPAILAKLKQATVLIRARTGDASKSGTGFLLGRIGNTGYIATNAHVIRVPVDEDTLRIAKSIQVVFNSGTSQEREVATAVVAMNPYRDLAILKLTDAALPERINSNKPVTPRETESVFILGFPFGDELAFKRKNPAITVSRAAVSSIRKDAYGRIVTIQIDGSINPGNSGGPIVTKSGDLVGIAVAKVKGTQIGWVIPAQQARDMLLGRVAMMTFEVTGIEEGMARFVVKGLTTDPLARLMKISLLTSTLENLKSEVAPTRTGQWKQAATRITTFDMTNDNGFLTGRFTVPVTAAKSSHLVQPVFTRRERERVFMEPARLVLPAANDLRKGYQPEAVSLRTGSEVEWYVRLVSESIAVPDSDPPSTPAPSESVAIEVAPRHLLRGHTDTVLSLAFSADGKTLASTGMDKTVRIWDLEEARLQFTCRGHTSWVWAVAISPHGPVVASSGGFDKTIRLWDRGSGSPLGELAGHTGKMRGIAISADGKWLVSASDDKTARVWNLKERSQQQLATHPSLVLSAAVSPDGRQFAIGGASEIAMFSLPKGTKDGSWKAHEKGILSLAYSLSGRSLVSASSDKFVKLWDVSTKKLKWEIQNMVEARSVAFLNQQGLLAVTDGQQIRILDMISGEEVDRFEAHDKHVKFVAASADGTTLATAGLDHVIKLWTVK